MKKIISLLLVLAMVSVMLVACNGNGNTETTTADNNVTTTTVGGADETTTTVADQTTTTVEGGNDETTTLPTTDPSGSNATTTEGNDSTTISETTTTTVQTTTTTPDGTTTIFNSEWGPFDTYDINTGERYTANMFVENKVTVTYATSITCSICKAWMKSYMNQLRTELEAKGAKVVVVCIFAASHWEEEGKVASIVEEYKAWYKANNGDYPFIVADESLQKNFKAASVPLLHIWVGGTQKGRMVASFHGTYSDPTGGYTHDALYKKIIEAVDFWLPRA